MKRLEVPRREPEDIDEYVEYVPPDEKKPIGIDILMHAIFILAFLMAAYALIMNLPLLGSPPSATPAES